MSVEISIPGGTAVLFSNKELTPRRRRPLQQADLIQGPLFAKIREARRVVGPDGQVEETEGLWGPDLVLTDRDAEILTSYQDKKIIARLASWTLDLPLPTTTDALLDIPGDVYDALALGIVKAEAADGPNPFVPSEGTPEAPGTLDDPASPTGASAV
jgi:hypothetical protein